MAMRARDQRQHRRRAPHAADDSSGANATEAAYARHQALMRVYASTSTRTTSSSYADDQHHHVSQHDLDVIQRHFQFLRDDDADAERGNSDWEVRMSVRYYRKLYREYALADLSRFEEGKIGLRWRTESEVIAGKGQFVCGSKHCDARATLHSYELLFAYVEQGEAKRCLVKVRVCEACAAKLFFKKLERMRQKRKMKQQKKKKKRKMEEIAMKKRKRSDSSSSEEDNNHDDADENSIHAICAAINAEETKDSSEATSSAYYFEDKKGERDHAFGMLLL